MATEDANTALSWTGSICSVLGLSAVIILQNFEFSNWTLLFWWLTTAVIAIAAVNTCFTVPSLPLRAVFAVVFVAQLPAFDWSWGELHERDTVARFRFVPPIGSKQEENTQKMESLENQNTQLRRERRESLLFWESIAHLTGMGFALLAGTAAGQRRVRMEYDAS